MIRNCPLPVRVTCIDERRPVLVCGRMYALRELADELLRAREARRGSVLERPCEVDVTVVRALFAGHLYAFVFPGPATAPKIRHSQLKCEEDEVVHGMVVSENASVWRTSAEIDVKGK